MERGNSNIDISMICQWNDKSIELLYGKYYRALVAYASRFVDMEIAEDIVQELFTVLWEHRPTFNTISQLSAYFYSAVHNSVINHLRRQNVRNNYKQNIIDNLQEFMLVDDMSDVFNKEDIYRQLFLAIDYLPPRQREIFLLCMDGKKNWEIAEQLEISAETVKVQKRRAINHLRERLAPMALTLLYLKLSALGEFPV